MKNRWIPGAVALFSLALSIVALTVACQQAAQVANSPAGVETGICILAASAADVAQGGMTPLAIVVDVAKTCRTSELEVARMLESHAAAAAAMTPAQARAMVEVARRGGDASAVP